MDISNRQNKLSGEELKNFMIDGRLPDEYISEENLNTLLAYEFEQMGDKDEYYDMSVANYCRDLLVEKYTDKAFEIRKQKTFKKIQASINLDSEGLFKHFDKDELIKYLHGVMQSEIKKSNEMDSDLINECAEWLIELQEIKIELTEEEGKRRAKAITEKHYKPKQPKKKRFTFKYATAILVFIFIGWLSFEAVSVTAFNNNFFDGTAFLSKAIFSIFRGNEIEEDGTARVSSSMKEYKTIEKLNEVEKVDIIVPNWLPDDIEIENINYLYEYGEINIWYDDKITLLTIKIDSTMAENIDGSQIYQNNKIKFYVFTDSNIIMWYYNGNLYSFACGFDISEYADKIIENIK